MNSYKIYLILFSYVPKSIKITYFVKMNNHSYELKLLLFTLMNNHSI